MDREALLERRGASWRLNAIEFPAGSAATLWCSAGVCPAVEVEPLEDADAGSAWTWLGEGDLARRASARRLSVAGARESRSRAQGTLRTGAGVAVTAAVGGWSFRGLAFRRALELAGYASLLRWRPGIPKVRRCAFWVVGGATG